VYIPGELIPITLFAVLAIIGGPIARAVARRIDRDARSATLPNDVGARLERMEQAIDAIAVEVERIAEGQRFTSKLLSDRASEGQRDRVAASRTPTWEDRRA
jgi:hypothetical protein